MTRPSLRPPRRLRRRDRKNSKLTIHHIDLLLLLDLDVDDALQRIGVRGDTANEFEKRGNLERCREIFLSLQDESFVTVIPTEGTLDEVTERILSAVSVRR